MKKAGPVQRVKWVLMGQPRVLDEAPRTFQSPLWVGQPREGRSLGKVPLEPLVRAGSFTDLWGGVGRWPR